MYLYFDRTGVLKEIINDEALRQGNYGINKMYIYIENRNYSSINVSYANPEGTIIGPQNYNTFTNPDADTPADNCYIPWNPKRDLKYFKYWTAYKFLIIDLEATTTELNNIEVALGPGPLDVPGIVHCSLSANLETSDILQLGDVNFLVQASEGLNNEIAPEHYLSLSNYLYLRSEIDSTKDWVENNFQPSVYPEIDLSSLGVSTDISVKDLCDYITNNNLSFNKSYIVKTGATYPGGPLMETAVFINFALIYPEHYWIAFKTPDVDQLNISGTTLSIIANSFDGTLEQFDDITLLTAFRPRTIKKLYRHLLGVTGDGGYAVWFELINDDDSSMTITGSFDSTTKTLSFSNINKKYRTLKFIGVGGSNNQYLYATVNYLGTTDTVGTLKIRTYHIQNDGTLSPITTYATLTDTVEEI